MPSPRLIVRGADDERDFRALTPILEASLAFDAADTPRWYDDVGRENFRFAVANGRVVGGYVLYAMGHRFGGRTVPAGGVAGVAVAPEHRASGVGRALMRDALAECGRRGLSVSSLFPATVPVYRRAGYEIAGTYTQHRVAASAIDVRDAMPAVRPLTDDDQPAIEACEARAIAAQNGPLVRSAWLWKRLLHNPTRRVYRYGIDSAAKDGSLDAFVSYIQTPVDSTNHYEIAVRSGAVLTAAAGRRLLSFFASQRSMCDAVLLRGPPVEPLLLHLREMPTTIERRLLWMLRVVDVKAALEQRGYPAGLSSRVTIDVEDVMPANSGRFALDVEGGRARVRRGGRGGVRIDVRGLASLFTSLHTPQDLARVGLLSGSDRDVAALGAIFAGPAPWIGEVF